MGLHKRGRKPFVFCGRRRYNGKKFAARFSARMAADHTAKTDPALHEGAGSVSGFGTVYSAEAYIGPEVRKLPGSGRRGAGRRDAAARPQGGRAFGAAGAKASAPSSVYGPAPLLQHPMPEAGSVSFLRDTGAKRKGAFHTPLAEQICFAAAFRAALSPDRSGKPAAGPADPLCGS